jgi:ABC-2 type transport system ATP-binding protein
VPRIIYQFIARHDATENFFALANLVPDFDHRRCGRAWTYTNSADPTDPNYPNNYDNLELQIVGSATAYEDFTQYGYMNVSNVQVTLPTAETGAVQHEDWPELEDVSA